MLSPKKQDFGQESHTHRKKNPSMNHDLSKSVKIISHFQCQKLTELFQKKSFQNINLGDHFLVKTLFSRLKF